MSPTNDELAIEIKYIKEDIAELKNDNKEQQKFFNTTIAVMQENLVELTTITKTQVERNEKQDKKLDKISEDVTNLRVAMSANNDADVSWYQNFINNHFGLVWKTLILIILILSGFKIAEIDVASLLK